MERLSTEIIDLLRNHFPQIAEKALQEEIATVGKISHFKSGEKIMSYGSYVKQVPLVVEGSIKVVRQDDSGREVFLYYLEKGETCSSSFTCCMMNKKSIIETVAEEDTTVIGIPIRYMDTWMSKYQSWKNFIMLSYEHRLNELVKAIDSIAFRKMDERLLEYLEKKSVVTGSPVIYATHQQIASDLNASREGISRLLKQLEKEGKARLGRNEVQLL